MFCLGETLKVLHRRRTIFCPVCNRKRDQGSSAIVFWGSHNHIRRQGIYLCQRAQNIGVKRLVSCKVRDLDTQQILDGTCNVVALHDLCRVGNRLFKGLLPRFGVVFQAHGDIGHETLAQSRPIQNGAIAGDNAAAFKFLHPPKTGRGRKAHTIGKFDVGNSPISAKDTQYMVVYLVKLRHSLLIYPPILQLCNPVVCLGP